MPVSVPRKHQSHTTIQGSWVAVVPLVLRRQEPNSHTVQKTRLDRVAVVTFVLQQSPTLYGLDRVAVVTIVLQCQVPTLEAG